MDEGHSDAHHYGRASRLTSCYSTLPERVKPSPDCIPLKGERGEYVPRRYLKSDETR